MTNKTDGRLKLNVKQKWWTSGNLLGQTLADQLTPIQPMGAELAHKIILELENFEKVQLILIHTYIERPTKESITMICIPIKFYCS